MEELLFAIQLTLNQNFYLLIFLGGLLFSLHARRRGHFAVRLLAGLALCIAVSLLMDLILAASFADGGGRAVALEIVRSTLIFSASAFAFYLAFDFSPTNALFVSVLGYTLEHLGILMYSAIAYYVLPAAPQLILSICYLAVYTCIYSAAYVVGATSGGDYVAIDNDRLVLQSGVFLFASIVLSVLSYDYIVMNPLLAGTPAVFIVSAFGILICLTIIFALLDSFHITRMKEEIARIQELWHEDVRRYELSKETVDMLNIRYHDLKKRMEMVVEDAEAADEISRAIDEYDDTVRTGNEAMDIVLTEKNVLCRQHGISMTIMADGGCLAGLGPVEAYSILGNLIENAMEYLQDVPEDKRVISVVIRNEGDMDIVQVENYYDGEPLGEDFLPSTTKPDKDSHGFGLKSVLHTIRKYDGILRVSAESGLFSVTAAIPRSS